MRKILTALVALAIALARTGHAHAQIVPKAALPTDPRRLYCDPKSYLLTAPESFGVKAPTIRNTCGAFEKGGDVFTRAQFDVLKGLDGVKALGLFLHGDTAFFLPPAPPPVVVPIDSTPPTTPPSPPPADTAKPIPPPVTPAPNPGTPPIGYVAIDNTNPMGPLTASPIYVPAPKKGRTKLDTLPGGGCNDPPGSPVVSCKAGEGAVRILSNYVFMAQEDPIAFFGQPGKSHLHQFFGNDRVGPYTTPDSLLTRCGSTNSGAQANCTAYWTPAMVDGNGQVVKPSDWGGSSAGGTTIYYKSGFQMDPTKVTPMPTGLKMIAGDKTWSNTKQNQPHVWWVCADGPGPDHSPTIPDCVGRVELIVVFPQCWDGVNLDSKDHQSHMAYPNFVNDARGGKSTCPSTHKVVVPEITELFFWPVPKGVKSSTWHISSDMDLTKPGGLTAHADWMMGWKPEIMAQLVRCLNASKDVGTNGLCNGTYMNPPNAP